MTEKRYYPVFLDVRNRKGLVVGGGAVATRKVQGLLDCGAQVTVVSPEVTDRLLALHRNRTLSVLKRPYRPSDLEGMFLVVGATDDPALNRRVFDDADRAGILCNVVDQPDLCSFILPAVIRRGDLTIAVSTSGKSPAFAKKLRQDLEKQFGEEYALFLKLMGAIRHRLLGRSHAPETHRVLFERLIERGLLDRIRNGQKEEINVLLHHVLGPGFDYDTLMCGENGNCGA